MLCKYQFETNVQTMTALISHLFPLCKASLRGVEVVAAEANVAEVMPAGKGALWGKKSLTFKHE